MRTDADKPAAQKRYRNIKAVIWRNQSEKGPWYSTEYIRTYKDGDEYKDAHTFSGDQNLVVSRLAVWAFEKTAQLEAQDRENTERRDAA